MTNGSRAQGKSAKGKREKKRSKAARGHLRVVADHSHAHKPELQNSQYHRHFLKAQQVVVEAGEEAKKSFSKFQSQIEKVMSRARTKGQRFIHKASSYLPHQAQGLMQRSGFRQWLGTR